MMSVFQRPVLVVDDSEVVRSVLGEMLQRFGFDQVRFAASAREALEVWASDRPGIVLLDITMPEVPGTRVATHILRDDPGTKVIVVSAVSRDAALVESVIALGVYDYLRKPVRQDDLAKVLQRIRDEESGRPGFRVPRPEGWGPDADAPPGSGPGSGPASPGRGPASDRPSDPASDP